MRKVVCSLAAILVCSSFGGAYLNAQEASKLENMVVVSSAIAKSIYEIPASVWYIQSDEIQDEYRQGSTLGSILAKKIPSLDLSSNGRTNFAQNLRGRSMLVMIDGVSLNSSRRVGRHLDSIDVFNIDHIEVLSGASSVYGAGASGGIINIITKKSGTKAEAETFVKVASGLNSGEDLDFKIGQSVSGGTDKISGRLGIVYGTTKAQFSGDGKMIVPDITQGSRQYNDNIDITGSLRIKPSDNQQIDIFTQYYNSRQDMQYGVYFGEKLSGILKKKPQLIVPKKGFESDRQAQTTRKMVNFAYNVSDILGGQTLYAQLSHRDEDFDFLPFPKATFFSASNQKTKVTSGRIALAKQFDSFLFTYGVDGYFEDFTSNQMLMNPLVSLKSGGLVNKDFKRIGRYPDVKNTSLSAFVQADYDINDVLTLSGGYRYQHMNNKIDDFIGVSEQEKIAAGKGKSADFIKGSENDYGVHLFNLGLTYKISPNASVWANFSQGFELPDPAKNYGNGVYEKKPDANGHYKLKKAYDVKLEGIKTNSYEIGARWSNSVASLQGALYYSLSDKSVEIVKDKTNLRIYEKDDEQRVYGMELAASYLFMDKLQIGASTHLVKTELKSNGGWKKMTIIASSPSKATGWLAWQGNDFVAKISSKTLFDLEDAKGGEIEGYTTFDFSTSYKIGAGTLSFGIENIFDKDYTNLWGQRAQALYGRYVPKKILDYKGRGRTFTLGYSIKY